MHYSYRYIRYTIQSYSIAHIGMKEIYSCAKLKVKHLHWWKKKNVNLFDAYSFENTKFFSHIFFENDHLKSQGYLIFCICMKHNHFAKKNPLEA